MIREKRKDMNSIAYQAAKKCDIPWPHEVLLRAFLEQHQILTEPEIQTIIQAMQYRKVPKGTCFVSEGTLSREFALVKEGFFRHLIRETTGEEKTYSITFPNQIIASYGALISGKGSSECIEAITDAELLLLPFDVLETQLQDNLNWLKFSKTIIKSAYVELENRVFQLLNKTPKERYLELLAHRPHYVQQIPLKFLASYLGISSRHLSRLRREITL
ncbi:Crp/Fnr family transcriptional regulator [Algoriphagus lacus]|uniref:Crp/Fnr family transcriptional regulator n=1 Tax=Algoriphagus lacus TaxID=2056311 RepID=A0A418PNU5_9BACT|nr:Crp/Fnr family transcriptional regulator [Algoriphagus lacus]RIW13416.1 Crp/Fnr family transcriptional regulator [Algoriphagus lacus]